ncbi:AAA family ATPase [Thermoactinomyces mirandus]|uniref:AAA family ATPase n=1 Tax=Thermoactinomyces mirandus TaxID=2756294 RepID=A0A7W1XSW0_9BACL|nr:AAA family ATPase [Thermoactinomyces mirandus]MBA4602604.1 AAA family ATPase [Thermoactinomyces mirandus]
MSGAGAALVIFLVYLGFDPLPVIVLTGIGLLLYSGGTRSMQKTARIVRKNQKNKYIPSVNFDEIGGQYRAKNELKEALDFLLQREKIARYGIRPVKGILLTGPPGTGKTLMAKASAHYTDAIFVSASGSEFVEMYVGVGAKRIRSLFQEARSLARKHKKNRAIVFIDEIDVIGGKRDGSQQREYDQTLNQLLTEMDGISVDQEVQVLVIAATNRKDMLDPALLRPGRFDRHIHVDLPDKKARLHILQLHTKNKTLHSDISLMKIAEETFGFSGAQLESLANEAAIYALRENKPEIEQKHLASAIDKVLMGEKADREASSEEKKRVAVHEMGHALISEYVRPGSVSEITLTPRGQALGYVRQLPDRDRVLYTREDLENSIRVCLAGAAAEEYFYGHKSTGAQNDYKQAYHYARTMIEAGLSDLGIISPDLVGREELQLEAKKILEKCYDDILQCMGHFSFMFEESLGILLKEEVLSGDKFREMLMKSHSKTDKIYEVN